MTVKMAAWRDAIRCWLLLGTFHVAFSVITSHSQEDPGFQVRVSQVGTYEVLVNGSIWLKSAPTELHVSGQLYSTGDGSLLLIHTTSDAGTDAIGRWTDTSFLYHPQALDVTFTVSVKVYHDVPMVLFGQHFPDGVENTTTGDSNKVVSSFPSFLVADPTSWGSESLGYLAYGSLFFGDFHKSIGLWKNSSVNSIVSGLDSGPLVLFDKVDSSSVIISPYNQFMAMSAAYETRGQDSIVSWGVMGATHRIPKGFQCWTSLTFGGEGVNMLLEEWGEIMRRQYRRDTSYRDSDMTNNYLGYYTDNGAYYYYTTEPGLDYETTLVDVKKYADGMEIPYRYIQYDSWWYPKDGAGGVTDWTSLSSVFPSGLREVWNKTGLPVVAHNRYWSSSTVYASENGGPYNFIIERDKHKAIPLDQTFWNDLMAESKKWGLIVYEQDWLNVQFDQMAVTVSDVHVGSAWLRQMGNGAARAGITIQYCMAPPRTALQSLEIPVVTQARASTDYQPDTDQWKIGVSSIFTHALGVAPFKDNFWTTSDQPGNKYGRREPYPALHAVVATLSTGPVGPSDMLGKSDRELIMRSCNADGLLLKPSRPATAINKQLIQKAFSGFTGEVWSTVSLISHHLFGTIFGANMENETMTVSPSDAGFGKLFKESIAFPSRDPASARPFSEARPLELKGCSNADFCLFHTSPTFSLGGVDVLLLGETSKWVPMSPKRVRSITVSTHDITVTLTGGAGERVTFMVLYGQSVIEFYCRLSEAGLAELSLAKNSCE